MQDFTKRTALLLLVGFVCVLSACVDEPEEPAAELTPLRTLQEAHLAEEAEALLPGEWVWDHQSSDGLETDLSALTITYLGNDAVSGDMALLLKTGDDAEQTTPQVQAASIRFTNSSATLHLNDRKTSWDLQLLHEDTLELRSTLSGSRLIYRRVR